MSGGNDVAIGFSASAATIFPSSYYTTRVAVDPPGSTSPAVVLRAGLAFYERTFDSIGGCSPSSSRWGDYSGTALDPVDGCFWVYNEHALLQGFATLGNCGSDPPGNTEDGRWGTAWGRSCACSASFALTGGVWKQISLPCNPGMLNTVADVFGDDLSGAYGGDWVVYRRDEAAASYVALTLSDSLDVGESYWIITTVDQTVDIEGASNRVTDSPLTGVATSPPSGCGSSAEQCNKVGHPHNYDVCWADVLVVDGAMIKTLAEADPAGTCETTGSGCIMSRVAHLWTGSSYETFDGVTMGMEGSLVLWDGLWVSAYKPGIQLRIPATPDGSGGSCGAASAPVSGAAALSTDGPVADDPSGWFIRLIVESGSQVDRANVFGQLSDSVDEYDSHDLIELDPFGNDYLSIVFPHREWGAQSGNYASSFHRTKLQPWKDAWTFEVLSSDSSAQVVLRWQGPDSQISRSKLVDNETNKRIRPNIDGSYAFTMTGPSRSFTWEIQGADPSAHQSKGR